MGYRSATVNAGTSTTPNVVVPSGAAEHDICVLDLWLTNDATNVDATINAAVPSGFILVTAMTPLGSTAQATRGRVFTYWKRLTAADSGSYTFSAIVSTEWELHARLYSGRIKVGNPWNAVRNSLTGTSSTATSHAIPSTTPGSATADVVGACFAVATGNWTQPTGHTKRTDLAPGHGCTFDDSPVGSAGATGTATASHNGAGSFMKGYQFSLTADDHVDDESSAAQVFGSTAAQTVILPAHRVGSRITIGVFGKYDTATPPTISAGWTRVKEGTGGTGVVGADTGIMFGAIFQRDVVAGDTLPLTNPTVTPGATAPNTWCAITTVHSPSTGKVWRDAIAASAGYAEFGSDTDTAGNLQATLVALSLQPETGDAVVSFGGVPADTSGLLSSLGTTATGLADGNVAGAPGSGTGQSNYAKNSLGNDMAIGMGDWTEFTGTASSGITSAFAFNLGNHSGILSVVALRQIDAPADQTAYWGIKAA